MIEYPETKRGGVVETLHGHEIADPYRWLEDPDSEETRAWVGAQRNVTEAYLEALPERRWFAEAMRRVMSRPRAGIPVVKGGWHFLSRNDGEQAQNVWTVARDLDGLRDPDARVILDPNAWSADGSASLSTFTVAGDGSVLACAVSEGGSDWQNIRFLSVADGSPLPEAEVVTKFCEPVWLPDNVSFLYNRYTDAGEAIGTSTATLGRQQLVVHRLGTSQDDDVLVVEYPDDDRVMLSAEVTHDDRWLAVHLARGTENVYRLWLLPLDTAEGRTSVGSALTLVDTPDSETLLIRTDGPTAYLRTDRDAPLGRVVAVDLDAFRRAGEAEWRTLVPEQPDALVDVVAAGDVLLAEYLVDASPRIVRYSLAGERLGVLDLPAGANVATDGSPERTTAYVGVSTVTEPVAAFAIDTETGATTALDLADSGPGVAGDYTVDRRRATSADGVQVPYFLIRPTSVQTGVATSPTLLYGYGGFKIPVLADYRPGWSAWLAAGGTLAIANLRGGGEFGTPWYEDGRLTKKQNVFNDVVAVAEHLIETGVTTPGQLAVHGRSNGGLLAGAALTQRPDLFAAALPVVGVLDMLRFHKFTIGSAWISDYGDPDVADDFEVALAYSPLHNVHPGTHYPATLIATGDHDDRVVPLHSHKFAAALQAAQVGGNPVLTRIEVSTGHGAGKPSQVLGAEWADLLAFAAHHTGLVPPLSD